MITCSHSSHLVVGSTRDGVAMSVSQPDVLWATIMVIGTRYNMNNRKIADGKLYELKPDSWLGYSSLDQAYDDIDIEDFVPDAFRLVSDTPLAAELDAYLLIRQLRMMALVIGGRAVDPKSPETATQHNFIT